MNKFLSIIENIRSEHVYIQTHNFPDPDAIASAYGLSMLLKEYGIDSSICYRGKIERYCTTGLVTSLDIEMKAIEGLHDMACEDEVILVDSQKGNANVIDTDGDEIICIDHHSTFESSAGSKYRFADIRPEVGACSTIIAEYYFLNNVEVDVKVATALVYGIFSDTMGLSRDVSDLDVDMYGKLYKIADKKILKSLEHCSIRFDELKAYSNAINSIKVYDQLSFANTGTDCQEGLIASICDFMLDIVEVTFSVVYSIKKDGIKLSVRSSGEYNAGKIANKALDGIGSGGGHQSMAGGFVPIDSGCDIDSLIIDIENRFLSVISE